MEKLKDPRWQKKRLEILTRDSFTCQRCLSTENTLHIHHRHYLKSREPWDYPSELLATLCYSCHQKEEDCASSAEEILKTMHYWGYFNVEIVGMMNKLIEEKIKSKQSDAEPNIKRLDKV